ncbi:MAG: universal stress protein, partial [Phycisphaerales bacterium]
MPFDGPVLVGIDFTPSCLAALRVGRRLAQERKVPARALHVIDSLVVADLADSLGPAGGGSVADVLSRDAVNAWRTFSGSAFEAVPLEVVVDHRVHGLLDAVVRYSPSLLVLGAFGSRPADVGAGTTATAAVRRGGCDVLLVRDTHEGAFRRILVGVDFSETSLKALRVALEIARDEGASTEVLHVFHGPWHALHYRAPTPEADPRFQVQFRNAVDRRLAVVV